jgi:plasmid stabilization system protein ParE
MKRFKIVYTQAAVNHIIHIIEWYNKQSKGLGKRFEGNLKKELSAIKKNPFTRSFRYDEVRFAVIKKFPYAAHYTVEDNIIIIHAVFGFKEDPEKWISRQSL